VQLKSSKTVLNSHLRIRCIVPVSSMRVYWLIQFTSKLTQAQNGNIGNASPKIHPTAHKEKPHTITNKAITSHTTGCLPPLKSRSPIPFVSLPLLASLDRPWEQQQQHFLKTAFASSGFQIQIISMKIIVTPPITLGTTYAAMISFDCEPDGLGVDVDPREFEVGPELEPSTYQLRFLTIIAWNLLVEVVVAIAAMP
jgi:hypothetical protein